MFLRALSLFFALLAGTAATAATIQLRASLNGSQEVPPNLVTPASGTGVMTFDTVTRQLTWTISFSSLQSAISDAHFHGPTPAGADAGIQVPIGPGASPLVGAAMLTVQQAANLLAGQYYINIHSMNLPGGEIRGQVLPVRNDFNADGQADIFWRHTDGTNYVWQVDGATINGGVLAISSQGLLPGVDTSWAVAGLGDFNGDGKLDILWRRNDGTIYIWHIDGSTINGGVLSITSQGLLPSVDTTWTVVGIGDFNGDGKSDILWRRNDGTNYVWHVDGTTINGGVLAISSQGLLPTVDTTWTVAGIGDFNGDGKADILWRRNDGTNYVWHVDGTTINGGVLAISSQGLLPGVDTSWSVVGIGDFNGEGRSDILWRRNDGTNYVWHVNGGTITGGVLAIFSQGLLPGVTDLGWSVVGVADYNGDGKADIFWRHTDGINYVWHVDGATINGGVLAISSQGLLPGVGAGWGVAPVAIAGNPPIANAGAPATYNGGETAALDGTGSSDPDGDPIVGYFWTQVSGTPVSLSNPRAAKPLFAVPNANDILTFSLIVSDGKAQSAASTVAITSLSYSGSAVVLQGNPFGESLDLPDGAMGVAVAGNYAYVADSTAGLKIIDISNPVIPTTVATFDTPGTAQRVKLSGNHAYVADHSGGVQIINVSNPAAPIFAGSYATSGLVFDVAVSGNLAFVVGDGYPASLNGFLDIVDISNPASPSRLGRYESYGTKWAVAVSGNHAYLASGGVGGLYVINISNPAAPTEVGSIASLTPTDLVVLGNQVFLADFDWGLRIIDVANPAAPSLIGSFNTAGPSGMQAFGISVAGTYAYLAGLNGMHVVNISNTAAPQLEGSYRVAHLSLYRGVAVAGQHAYLADQNHRLQVVDVSHPSFSSVLNSVVTPGIAVDSAMSGQHVIVEENASGMQDFNGMDIFHASGLAGLSLVARLEMPYGAQRVAFSGNHAFLPLYFDGIYVVDMTIAASPSPRVVYVYDFFINPIPSDIDVTGSLLYTIGSAGLRVFDVSDVTNPVHVGGSNDLPGEKIKVVGNLAYIFNNVFNRVEVINVSNPATPFLVGSVNTNGGATQISVAGNYLYLSGWTVQILDVSDPSNPAVIGNFNTLDTAEGIVVAGNYAYVPNRFYGTKILDISDPSAPFLAGRYDIPITANSAVVDADSIYITAGENGFARAERAPGLYTRHIEGTAGNFLGYTVGWRDTEIPANVQVKCQVTGGSCAVTGIDQDTNTASVQWSLPSTPGHYEVLFIVGNWQRFITTKDRVTVH